MSATILDMARSSFSTAAFAQLVRRLRHTNARYNQIARQFRCRLRPTHHAKRRAFRAGLRIDTLKARACPEKYISHRTPAVLDLSAITPSWVDPQTELYAPSARQEDAYMRGPALRNLPRVVVRKNRRRDGRHRVVLRLPPLKLQLNVGYSCGQPPLFQEPVPGAPRLLPRQLPEDESGVEEMMLGSAASSTSFMDRPDALLTPLDVQVYSGLCITIPPRSVKRKLQDVEADGIAPSQQPKRILRARWNESQRL
ncbi:hypothetical protein JVT61DRAFT_6830 [Boletus reticuloceps]|uniref:Uncharacterized protein n=1 Tax=Boletus reticuloceps TaxID=495285 RepID=A0A8I2YKJ3_9AGAM|nr:hypothetical protein JVT61DRAFT_6830 [Boletus reticuloceps]